MRIDKIGIAPSAVPGIFGGHANALTVITRSSLGSSSRTIFFIYDMVVHVMYKCMHEAFTGRSSGSGCLPAMAAPPMDGHGGSAHGSVVCSGRSGGPVCTRHGIGSAVETSPPPGPGIAAMGS